MSKDSTGSSNISSSKDNASNLSCMPPSVGQTASFQCMGVPKGLVMVLEKGSHSEAACNKLGIVSLQKH